MKTVDYEMVWGEEQTNHAFSLSADLRSRGKLVVPATVGNVDASVSLYPWGAAPFKASVLMTLDPGDFDGIYGYFGPDFHLQVGGTTEPGTNVVIVEPGQVWYFNSTLAHDGKTGGGKGQVYPCAAQLRSVA